MFSCHFKFLPVGLRLCRGDDRMMQAVVPLVKKIFVQWRNKIPADE